MIEAMIRQVLKEQSEKLEEVLERSLVTGTHGVAQITNTDLDQMTSSTEWIITDRVPWGEIYYFPSRAAWEAFCARDTPTRIE